MSEQEIEVERVYTVPLSRAWIAARHRRTRRAVNILREFAEHHMKSSEIKIDTELNEELWKKGITRPPRRITVRMEKDEDGVVTISLPKEAKKRPEIEATTPAPVENKEEPAPEPKSVPPQSALEKTGSAIPATPAQEQPKKTARKTAQKKATKKGTD